MNAQPLTTLASIAGVDIIKLKCQHSSKLSTFPAMPSISL